MIETTQAPATDPCGGNTAGGDGCRCDPPFVISR